MMVLTRLTWLRLQSPLSMMSWVRYINGLAPDGWAESPKLRFEAVFICFELELVLASFTSLKPQSYNTYYMISKQPQTFILAITLLVNLQ